MGVTTLSLTRRHLSGDDPLPRRCDILLSADGPATGHRPAMPAIPPHWLQEIAELPICQPDPSVLDREAAANLTMTIQRTSDTPRGPSSPYRSNHTSSIRQPLYWLFTIIVSPFTSGCQQVAARR